MNVHSRRTTHSSNIIGEMLAGRTKGYRDRPGVCSRRVPESHATIATQTPELKREERNAGSESGGEGTSQAEPQHLLMIVR